jgi:diguanylate cyclase (GGDEF)-like protein
VGSEDRSSSKSLRRKTVVTVISKIGDRKPKADACFVVIYGQSIGRMYRLKPGEVLIGRSSQAHIQIDHESVSRRHAQVDLGERTATVRDLGSTNGTYVNDEPVHERKLQDGDLIKVGRTILKYLASNNIEASYHDEIYRLTTIDGLTRCFNRRYLREQLIREVSRSTRYRRALSLVVFDIDRFKQINDEYGHLAGDAVLTQMGKRIQRRIRREDILARYGGGEFAIVCPEIGKDNAVQMAGRIMELIAQGTFGFEDVEIPVSICMGAVTLEELGDEDPQQFEDESGETVPGDTPPQPFSIENTSEIDPERDRFHSLGERMFSIARDRLQRAKAQGRGVVVLK